MLGVGVLNWYPNRNPSEEIKRTTGCPNFLRGRARAKLLEIAEEESPEVAEKKRKAKAKAADRAMQVMRIRAMKMTVVNAGRRPS